MTTSPSPSAGAGDPPTELDRNLVEALADLYEVVVLMTGRVGPNSSLPLFDGLHGRLVLVTAEGDDPEAVAETRERLLDAGFRDCEIAAAPARVAA